LRGSTEQASLTAVAAEVRERTYPTKSHLFCIRTGGIERHRNPRMAAADWVACLMLGKGRSRRRRSPAFGGGAFV